MNKLSIENPYIKLFIQYSLPILVIGIISRTFPITSPYLFYCACSFNIKYHIGTYFNSLGK